MTKALLKSVNAQLVVLFLVAWASPSAHACSRLGGSDLAIIGSYQSKTQTYRGRNSEYDLTNCNFFPGEYIILTQAPVYTDPQFKSISSPEGELPEERCSIKESPFNVSKPQDIDMDRYYGLQTQLLNSCLEFEITDERGEIDGATQINCEILQPEKNKIIARGPRCAFKIYENSEFKIKYRLNQACLDKTYLQQMGNIRPMDVKTALTIYRAKDLAPGNPDYDILAMINGRITLQPDQDLLPVAHYAGTAGSSWPTQYGTQIELGKLNFNRIQRLNGRSFSFLRIPFIVNNNCKETCKDGLCTSPCDFYAPVAARMTLKKKGANDSSFRGIDYWYQGSLVPPHFLGELSLGKELKTEEMKVGDLYLLSAEFSSPALTYRTIVNEAKQFLIKLTSTRIPIERAGRPIALEGLGTLGSSFLPAMGKLPELGTIQDNNSLSTDAILSHLGMVIGNDDSWPPYYNQVMNGDQTDNPNRIYLTLKVGFRVVNITPSGAAVLDHLQYMKESKIFGNFSKPVTIPPQIKCER